MGDRSIDALLEQLGAAAVGQRDLATKALIQLGPPARAPLRRLLATPRFHSSSTGLHSLNGSMEPGLLGDH